MGYADSLVERKCGYMRQCILGVVVENLLAFGAFLCGLSTLLWVMSASMDDVFVCGRRSLCLQLPLNPFSS